MLLIVLKGLSYFSYQHILTFKGCKIYLAEKTKECLRNIANSQLVFAFRLFGTFGSQDLEITWEKSGHQTSPTATMVLLVTTHHKILNVIASANTAHPDQWRREETSNQLFLTFLSRAITVDPSFSSKAIIANS